MSETQQTRIHATSISWQGRAALLLGPSASGKSSVALHMMALGCELIADDQCDITVRDQSLFVSCPPQISGQIEARNFGLLTCRAGNPAPLACAVDLGIAEDKRLPDARAIELCNQSLRLFHNPGIEALPFALIQYLKADIVAL